MNIVVMTIGRSGSSILVKMLEQLGYRSPDPDDQYGEWGRVRKICDMAIRRKYFDSTDARKAVCQLTTRTPWVLKDPRFILTLDHWRPLLDVDGNALVYLHRDHEKIVDSLTRMKWGTIRNGIMTVRGKTLQELHAIAVRHIGSWNGPTATISFEQLREAVKLFDLSRGI